MGSMHATAVPGFLRDPSGEIDSTYVSPAVRGHAPWTRHTETSAGRAASRNVWRQA